jgi:serine/threonine protein kinase
MLTHLNHRCIIPLFGIVFPTDSTNFTIATRYCENGSLKDITANPPSWWTPTAKSKAIVGIVHGMRFAHSFGCAHGALKSSNILFDKDGCVQITDLCSSRLQERVMKKPLDEGQVLVDVVAFCSILFEILIGRSVFARRSPRDEGVTEWVENGERVVIPSVIPSSMRGFFVGEGSVRLLFTPSFQKIYDEMKRNDFDIVKGNDENEVSRFARFLEASQGEGE